jgi:hypothetical protein
VASDSRWVAALIESGGGSTQLDGPVRAMLQENERVMVVTDQDGLNTLKTMKPSPDELELVPPHGVFIRVYTRTDNLVS